MELVTVTIDGKEVRVPKGTNLIVAAEAAGIEIPHYCYHKNLSVAGNCRMCQVQIEGQPKLTIACNTTAAEGMKVHTHVTSKDVAEAQRATLEFLLINHPIDCTVCDQAGHCKLQDYYYEYNSKASRFIEEKEHKVKAEVLGPEIVYDGERCIVCTRCVRFCDEVTHTGELGVFERGDRSVIGVFPGTELNNPLSGTVVDLCPVGALTHRRWRFNTRIWYTKEADSICNGCSTGCNAKVAVRDGRIVMVKARYNSDVNKEWMCDEGRYGFERFQPEQRLTAPVVRVGGEKHESEWEVAFLEAGMLKNGAGPGAVFISPFLTLEEMWVAGRFAKEVMGVDPTSEAFAVQIRKRSLSADELVLVSPDYAPNAYGAVALGYAAATPGDFRDLLETRYANLLERVIAGEYSRLLFIGDFSIAAQDQSEELLRAVSRSSSTVALTPRVDSNDRLGHACRLMIPTQTVNEKRGLMINGKGRIQRLTDLLTAPFGTMPEWLILQRMASVSGVNLLPPSVKDERALFREMAANVPGFAGLTLAKVGGSGLLPGTQANVEG